MIFNGNPPILREQFPFLYYFLISKNIKLFCRLFLSFTMKAN